MSIVIEIIIFLAIVLIFKNIKEELKVINDIEVCNIEIPSKETLEQHLKHKKPIFFYFNSHLLENSYDYISKNYSSYHINFRNNVIKDNEELFFEIKLKDADELFKKNIYSENNTKFVFESGLSNDMVKFDQFFRPPLCSKKDYDLIIGSNNTVTPLRYDVSTRNILYVLDGSITLKIISPKYSEHLFKEVDYDNYEFRSMIDPWNVQNEYVNEYNKIKEFEITLNKGDIIFIPIYWWYSIKFNSQSIISAFRYKSIYNNIVNIPNNFMYYLQQSNIERKIK